MLLRNRAHVRLPPRGALAFPNFLLHAPALFLAQAAQIGFSLVLGLAPAGPRIVAAGGSSEGCLIWQIGQLDRHDRRRLSGGSFHGRRYDRRCGFGRWRGAMRRARVNRGRRFLSPRGPGQPHGRESEMRPRNPPGQMRPGRRLRSTMNDMPGVNPHAEEDAHMPG